MKRRFVFGIMLAALIPAAMLAQSPASPYSSSERLLQGAGEQQEPTQLPVTLELNTPADNEWVQRVNANPTLSATPPVGSKAHAALHATVGTGAQLPQAGTVGAGPTPVYGVTGNGCYGCDPCAAGAEQQDGIRGRLKARVQSVIGETGPVREWLRNFEPNVFHKGVWSAEVGTQFWRSPIFVQSTRSMRMIPVLTRFGVMLNDPDPERRLKGVFQLLAEVDTIPIQSGAGNIIVGGSALLRYHRVKNHRIVPYYQVGFGGTYTDAPDFANTPTTSYFNFMFQVASGSQLFLNKKWALFSEGGYTMFHHFGMGDGPGIHVWGGLVGIKRFFGASDCACR